MRLVGRVLDKPEVVFKYDATVDGNVPPVTPLVIAEPAVDPFGAILVPVVVPPVTSLVVVVSSLPQPLVATLVVSVAPLVAALPAVVVSVVLVMALPAVEPLVTVLVASVPSSVEVDKKSDEVATFDSSVVLAVLVVVAILAILVVVEKIYNNRVDY